MDYEYKDDAGPNANDCLTKREGILRLMLNDLRYRFTKFMQGRYGVDSLSRFLSVILLVIIVIGMFVKIPLLELVTLAFLIILYLMRMDCCFAADIPNCMRSNYLIINRCLKA